MSGAEGPDTFVSIGELCRRFGFSRQTFYRMLNDPDGGLDEVAVRVPPPKGRLRIPVRRFEAWLRARQAGRTRGISGKSLGESGRAGRVVAHPPDPDHRP